MRRADVTVIALCAAYAVNFGACFAEVSGIMNYQGRVVLNGTNFTGTGLFKFALVDGVGTATFWSNDGAVAGEPATSISITVTKGLYSVLLGQSPMAPISPAVFTNTDVRLRVWFDGGSGMQQLSPDQRIGAVGYAMVAATVPGSGITGTIPDARMSGNVGIGTATPAYPLVVQKRSVAEPAIMIGGGFAGGPRLQTYGLDADSLAWMGLGTDMASGPYEHSLYFPVGPSSNGFQSFGSYDGTNYLEKMRVTSGGKVGIGTDNPSESLEVDGRLVISDSGNGSPKAGTIRWTGTDFQGYDGGSWVSLTMPAPAGMVLVPGGTFTMGSAAFGENAVPEHQVVLGSFYLARNEVTYGLWYTVAQWALANGYYFQNAGREGNNGTIGAAPTELGNGEPVTYISWRDSIVWCNARSQREGLQAVYTYSNSVIRDSRSANATACDNAAFSRSSNGYRLPTEAEWEYAARYIDGCSWTPGNFLSGSSANYSNAAANDAVAWFWQNSSNTTHTAGTKKPNQLGVLDMSGNMAEFCWDRLGTYDSATVTNPVGPGTGTLGLYRGGAAFLDIHASAAARRNAGGSTHTSEYEGFRCARNAQ